MDSTLSRWIRSFSTFRMARERLYTIRSVSPSLPSFPLILLYPLSIISCWVMFRHAQADKGRLTNAKPSAIYRLRPHLPPDAPLPLNGSTPPANLGIEIAPQAQLESLLTTLEQGDKGKGKEVAERVDVGKVAEKVVKNVRHSQCFSYLDMDPVDPYLGMEPVDPGYDGDADHHSCSTIYIRLAGMSSSRTSSHK